MPTTHVFAAQFGAAPVPFTFTASATIEAAIDDGSIAVGDLVTFTGLSTNVETFGGISGSDGYYLGDTIINGFTFYIFGEANTVGGNTSFLGFSDDIAAATATTAGFFSTWAASPTALGTALACFAAGTQISTPGGETRVEDLGIGDLVRTADCSAVPVKWIGRQTILKTFAGDRAQTVRIRAGALGHGLPRSDLTVTGDHGIIVDGMVINASALVNGTSVNWVPLAELPQRFTVYHVETAAHDVILANGAASETYLDIPGRQVFDNYQEYVNLYGAERVIDEMPVPRISSQRLVPDAIKARLGIAEAEVDWGAGRFTA